MTSPPPSRRRSRNWLWFFGILASLTIAAVVLENWYNWRQQLQLDQIATAREKWRAQRPTHFQLDYLVKRRDGNDLAFSTTVRDGQVVSVQGGKQDDPPQFDSMESLFDFMAKQLQADRQPGSPRVFVTATFDADNGQVLRYIRSVRATGERMEVTVRMRVLS